MKRNTVLITPYALQFSRHQLCHALCLTALLTLNVEHRTQNLEHRTQIKDQINQIAKP